MTIRGSKLLSRISNIQKNLFTNNQRVGCNEF
jgi:hypothetical protein